MFNSLLLAVVFTLLISVLSGWVVKESFSNPLITVEGQAGSYKMNYRVRDRSDRVLAANTLARLTQSLNSVIIAFENDAEIGRKHADKIAFLKSNWKPENIEESDPDSSTTSYSLNKGNKLVFCIRHKDDDGTFVDDNTLVFVGIHELAHLMTTEVGHTPLFWSNMKMLLEVATKQGIYKPENYEASPKKYCGIEITNSPLNDSDIN